MKKINESFVCIGCGKEIPPAKKTCRNHCPYCFTSLHVDGEIPGDRSAECKGKMFPVEYFLKNGERKILFKCSVCGKEHWNKKAEDDDMTMLLSKIKREE
ncbi:MAG: hypothetical protein CR971_01070 [candidate division SR1 bacterium]|nr:MAG: hypothetical protein CR971_01070 [candidate division SR1 bacterium]